MPVEIISEVSSNHGGDLGLAKEFVWRCAEAGANWVKFQHTRVAHLRPTDPQFDWFQQAEMSVDQFAELKAECKKAGTKFLTTVYNAADVPEVLSLGLEAIKIGSGEAHEASLFRAVLAAGLPRVFVSVSEAPYRYNVEQFRVVARYPAPRWLCAERTARGRFESFVGWSDHAIGLEFCQRAITHGARIIEKHVQLPEQKRPPKPYEATMAELRELRQFADEDPARFIGRWQANP